MTCAEFIENLNELHEGDNFSKDILRSLYASIKNAPLQWAFDSEEEKVATLNGRSGAMIAAALGSAAAGGGGGSDGHHPVITTNSLLIDPSNPFLEIPNNSATAIEYKRGYIMRKSCEYIFSYTLS